ncbi:MAG TPA: YggT family protein [bacterium]|nr:YggT family protein [bacterium]
MFVLGNLFYALAQLLGGVIFLYIWVIIFRVVISWVNADPYNGLVRFIHAVTEPVLSPVRRILPPWRLHGVDLSPMIVILILYFLKAFLVATLYDLGNHLR